MRLTTHSNLADPSVYDPATAQFLSRDPLAAISGEPYSYVGDNPLNRSDPTGLCGFLDVVCYAEEGANLVTEGVKTVGETVASVAPYAAPATDILAGAACAAVVEICGPVLIANFGAQQLMAFSQAAYTPGYNFGLNEAAIFSGTALGAFGVGAVEGAEAEGASLLGRTALGAAVSLPAWLLDVGELARPERAAAGLVSCQ